MPDQYSAPAASEAQKNQGLIPDFCDVKTLFILVLLCELLALVLSLAASVHYVFWEYLAFVSMLVQWIALLNAFFLCHLRNWLHRQRLHLTIFYSLAVLLSISLLVGYGSLHVLQHFAVLPASLTVSGQASFLVRICLVSLAVYAVALRFFYIQHQWRVNLQAQSHSRIQALTARIRPHFLFNSMNTIASLIAVSPEHAEKAIVDLSDLFRASLKPGDMNPLQDELALVDSYLRIESLRLGDRLEVIRDIDNTLNNIEIPALILQPLVENAIYHGIEPMVKGGKIRLSALQQGNMLVISIRNPFHEASERHKKGNRIAQDNIKQRLKLIYDQRAAFIVNDTKETYSVVLKIPLD